MPTEEPPVGNSFIVKLAVLCNPIALSIAVACLSNLHKEGVTLYSPIFLYCFLSGCFFGVCFLAGYKKLGSENPKEAKFGYVLGLISLMATMCLFFAGSHLGIMSLIKAFNP